MGRAKPKPLLAALIKLGDPVARSAISRDLRAFSASCSSRNCLTVNLALGPSTATATALQISMSKTMWFPCASCVEYSGSSALTPQGSEPVALMRSRVEPAGALVVAAISHAIENNSAKILLILVFVPSQHQRLPSI